MENSTKRFLKKWHALVAIFFLAAFATNVQAQNVTISPQNGSMICADLGQSSGGWQAGAFAMWKHEQLALTMMASGDKNLTDDGLLVNHRNFFQVGSVCTFRPTVSATDAAKFIDCGWGGSQVREGYYTISLPKGYRFTSYRFELSHDIINIGQGNAFSITTNTTVDFAETADDFGTAINSVTLPAVPSSNSGTVSVQTFTRTADDMGNILYFKATAPQNGYFDITFRHVELTFTADADSKVDILPSSQGSDGHSLLMVPFNTGKVDVGQISPHTTGNVTRISYNIGNVQDMSASMLLYEYDSTTGGTGFDGTSGQVAVDKAGSITTTGNYFRFAPPASVEGGEQVYVLETPVSAVQAGNIENPVQFRITGATINYTNDVNRTFHITYENGGTTYCLGTNGRFSTDHETVWEIDNAGHIYSGSSYLQGTDGLVSTGQASSASVYSITDDGYIRYRSGNTTRYLKVRQYTQAGQNYYAGYVSNSNSYTNAIVDDIIAAGTSGATIYVYDKEGNKTQTVTIDRSSSVSINNLNNDAILFGVKGGDVALLNFSVKLQALNPYIDQMTVVLNVKKDDNTNVRMTRSFTSDDFSVGGDTFEFYLPTELEGKPVDMTFEDLYSKYGDETYDHISGTEHSSSRYNYVMSQHHQAYSNDNIYNNTAEAKSGTMESVRLAANNGEGSMIRTKVGTVGDQPFVFNNADELASNAGYLREFPFTVSNYGSQNSNQYLITKPANGKFEAAHFTAEQVNTSGHTKTFYVFTTDETRYNIAPTTATQHRSYAFYTMVVLVQVGTYDPIATFDPIYTNAFYQDEEGNGITGDFYGVTITAPSNINTPLASDVAINKAIVNKIKQNISGATDAQVSAEMKKILYLDASPLSGVYHTSPNTGDEAYAVASFNALKEKFDVNALVFLPANATEKFNNFAYAKKGEVLGFQSANNIVLTDKHPFYCKYDIQVDAANKVEYTRLITTDMYGQVQNASLILPFAVSLTGGKHTNSDGTSFSLHTMQTTNALSVDPANKEMVAFFPALSGVNAAAANTPYLVKIEGTSNVGGATFAFSQQGGTISKTEGIMDSDYTIASTTTSTGTAEGGKGAGNWKFTMKGTYAGQQVPKDNNIFYFANNVFVNSKDYKYNSPIKILPFRAYFATEASANAKLSSFGVIFEEGEGNETDGIGALSSVLDVNAPVYDLQGRKVANSYREAKGLQSGMYVVNGVKIIVK